ncbi:hypothetical protein [Psychrobacter glacincola]|uniref:hypothetical protein n=1 Tax=Psychrobacter glacincola TaxID=56810 RepID=UPI0039B04676
MIQRLLSSDSYSHKTGLTSAVFASTILMTAMSVQAAPTPATESEPSIGIVPALIAANNASQTTDTQTAASQTTAPVTDTTSTAKPTTDITNTLAAQLQPSNKALSAANQELLSRNAQLQRQVNDLQTQANVLVYESKGQLFLYGAFTVLISLLVGIFISWLVFVRRERW